MVQLLCNALQLQQGGTARSFSVVSGTQTSLQSDDSELLKTIDDELIIPQIEAQSKNRNGFVKRKDKIRFPVYLHDL